MKVKNIIEFIHLSIRFLLLLPISIYEGTIYWWQEKHLENTWLDEVMEVLEDYYG